MQIKKEINSKGQECWFGKFGDDWYHIASSEKQAKKEMAKNILPEKYSLTIQK